MGKKIGRPRMFDAPTKPVTIRIPESVLKNIPEPKRRWMRDAIMQALKEKEQFNHLPPTGTVPVGNACVPQHLMERSSISDAIRQQ